MLVVLLCSIASCDPRCARQRRPSNQSPSTPPRSGAAAAHDSDRAVALEACAHLAGIQCNLEQRCFGGWFLRRVHGTDAACLDALSRRCIDLIDVPGTGHSPRSMNACASALAGLSCDDFANVGALEEPHCRAPPGQQGVGDACRFNDQCRSRRCVFPRSNRASPCGVCQIPLAAGADCQTDPNLCDEGLAYARGTCVRQVIQEGGPCNNRDLWCSSDRGLSCVAGSCRHLATKAGTRCDPRHVVAPDCQFRTGLHCDGGGRGIGACEPIALAKAGQACGSADLICEGLHDCIERGTGRRLAGALYGIGVCELRSAAGNPCDFTGTLPLCADGLTCTDKGLCGPAPSRKTLAWACGIRLARPVSPAP